MHLAGWNFTVYEDEMDKGTMNHIDVQNPDFSKPRKRLCSNISREVQLKTTGLCQRKS
jgi:hypothetical protein